MPLSHSFKATLSRTVVSSVLEGRDCVLFLEASPVVSLMSSMEGTVVIMINSVDDELGQEDIAQRKINF